MSPGADAKPSIPGTAPKADAKPSIPADHFFRSRWVDAPAGIEELDPAQLAPGFRAGGAHVGLKGGGKTDVGLLVCDLKEIDSALVLTRNASAAAPIRVCRDVVDQGHVRAAVINSGNANAETGEKGFADALAMAERAAEALGLETPEVAVAETGVIGVPMPMSAVLPGIEVAAKDLSATGGAVFSEAIMTTDRWPKRCTLKVDGVTLSAQAKGGGMIQPNMATMLCFVQTDAVVTDPVAALGRAVDASFNRITVDGQMSTNDTVLLQATGVSGKPLPEGLLEAVLLQLAIEIVRDGEGAARAGRIEVSGAADQGEAERVARAIANSPLVKTALYGRDPNWGRIAQAAGAALAGTNLDEIGSDCIDAAELGADIPEANIGLRLGRGSGCAHVYFSDLGHEYVSLNAEYTT
ncbi:MAG TPA: bifunctional glutamate N-acetyltransferase/amino-acid acetyltransferase ArgJ [Solirubrobacterales bacterium]|nr:bifunctional glutamate N-acetyltransferase/amino-acid acetyltransferase ArgJ [Solirubrobacterales bacterium]